MNNIECEPIFIVGSARSGTSAMMIALRDGAQIPGYNEGHYLTMMHGMIKLATEHMVSHKGRNPSPEVMLAHVNMEDITNDIMAMMKSRMETHFKGHKVWMDKTPDGLMMRVIPYIMYMWPKARFIFTKRRAIENISSRLRKFKHLSFERNCEHWAQSMELWQKFKSFIPENQRIEVDQYDMGLKPLEVAEKIGQFLGLTNDQTKGVGNSLSHDRIESTGGNEKNLKGLHDLGWTEEELEIYNRLCSSINREYGYSEDSTSYFLNN
ncbi:MAG: sulfotransferase [Patescibacteria group bacterium]